MRLKRISDGISNSNNFHISEIVNEEETEKLIPAEKWKEIVLIADGAKNAQPKVEVIIIFFIVIGIDGSSNEIQLDFIFID